MPFSKRTAWQPGVNAWTEALESQRKGGHPLIDLTVSNPTLCGLAPDKEQTLAPLYAPAVLNYRPEALGMIEARRAVAAYYRDHGCAVELERICLTTSTSEAYSFLLRLLCDPGDEVLIARPSYPLFELLAGMEDVALREYPLFYEPGVARSGHGAWSMDFAALEAALTVRTRAIMVVHPNNPTGHYVQAREREALVQLCKERRIALIVDEVFLDYPLGDAGPKQGSFASEIDCLCFVLSGLSKVCALPQMKASWIVACGPEAEVAEAMRRLEVIADTFLSMNAPIQHALPSWLAGRGATQERIRQRLAGNVAALDQQMRGSMIDRLVVEGGWTAVLRVPRAVGGLAFAEAALERGVLVQPGALYGLPESRCVVSLLLQPEIWQEGLRLLPI